MPRTKEVFQQMRESSRLNILTKAAVIFAEKGLANTKVSDLAKAAGVSQGLLYWYFPDKEEIFVALLEQAINGVTQYLQAALTQRGTPLEKIYWLTEQILRGMTENPVYFKIVSQALALSGKVKNVVLKFETAGKMLRELIAEGQITGEISQRNPDQLVFVYLSCIYGVAAGRSFNVPGLERYFPSADTLLQILKP